jgi:hypothetical protein|tara:strand:+ start:677 stop:1105 length:429 start_codon:yes stop_codon:yes gene_type:complete
MSSIIIDSEEVFKIQLLEDIGERFMVFKSNHKYSVVDFICINKNNLRNFHIEHKKRRGKKCSFKTLYIGFDKVNKVEEYFKETYYIWDYDNELYWVKHKKEFLERDISWVNGSRVYNIFVSEVNTGYDNFIQLINSFSNDRF